MLMVAAFQGLFGKVGHCYTDIRSLCGAVWEGGSLLHWCKKPSGGSLRGWVIVMLMVKPPGSSLGRWVIVTLTVEALFSLHSQLWSCRTNPPPLFWVSWKTQPMWNQFYNEGPADEGREFFHFLLYWVAVQICKNSTAGHRNLGFPDILHVCFSWMVTASMNFMMGTWFWINGKRRVKLCQKEHCNAMFFLTQLNFAYLRTSITQATQ